ncbi:MAG: hypothetical protein ACXABY_17015 [Candidatus Thorarchaeota archaeon]
MYDEEEQIDRRLFWEVVGEYSRQLRQCNIFFRVYLEDLSSEEEDVFSEIKDLILRLATTAREYMAAQFQGADMFCYPELEDLSTQTAVDRWLLYDFKRRIPQHVAQQERYVQRYIGQYWGSKEDMAKNPVIPFAPWFRLLYLEDEVEEEIILQALSMISVPELYEAVASAGYPVYKITRWRKEGMSVPVFTGV